MLPRTPFSPARKPDDDKEEDAGILAYVKDDDAVSADFHLGSLQNRKTLQGKEDAPQRGGLPEAKRRVSTTGAQAALDAKAWVSLLSEGKKVRNKINIPRSGDVYLHDGKSWELRSQMRTNVSCETFLLAVRGGIFRRGKGFPKLDLWLHFHM